MQVYLDKKRKSNLPRFSFTQWIDMFPEAIPVAKRNTKKELKFYKEKLSELEEENIKLYEEVICKVHFKDQNYIKEFSDRSYDNAYKRLEKTIKSLNFRLSFLNGKNKPTKNDITEADIERVKEIPIENFYFDKLNRSRNRATGKCPFHNDTNASLTIYLDQNSWWCYGCNKGGSVIDYIMLQQNVDFLSAVKFLLK